MQKKASFAYLWQSSSAHSFGSGWDVLKRGFWWRNPSTSSPAPQLSEGSNKRLPNASLPWLTSTPFGHRRIRYGGFAGKGCSPSRPGGNANGSPQTSSSVRALARDHRENARAVTLRRRFDYKQGKQTAQLDRAARRWKLPACATLAFVAPADALVDDRVGDLQRATIDSSAVPLSSATNEHPLKSPKPDSQFGR
jgi:hypothetical protein